MGNAHPHTHGHSLSQTNTRRDTAADGLRLFHVTDWTMRSEEWLSHRSLDSNCSHLSSLDQNFVRLGQAMAQIECQSTDFPLLSAPIILQMQVV